MGTLSRLGKIIGNDSLARELAFTARPFKVDEAVKMGFVSRVVKGGHEDVIGTALAVARVIGCESSKSGISALIEQALTYVRAAKSPIAVLGTKHLMNYSRDHTVAEGTSTPCRPNKRASLCD